AVGAHALERGGEGPRRLCDSRAGRRAVLRPELRRLYAAALAEHHHVSLDRQPRRAADLIGPDLWPWLGSQTPRTGPDGGIPVDVLRHLVDRLEHLGSPRTRTPGTHKEEAT
ncbi:hypothetical protein ACWEDZ_13300, partial [Streptomyces sp. NPDC005047]